MAAGISVTASATSERGFAVRRILPERHEIVMPAIQQRAEIGGAAGQTVIGGDRQHDRTFSAQMAFDRHGRRCPSDRAPVWRAYCPMHGATISISNSAFGQSARRKQCCR